MRECIKNIKFLYEVFEANFFFFWLKPDFCVVKHGQLIPLIAYAYCNKGIPRNRIPKNKKCMYIRFQRIY